MIAISGQVLTIAEAARWIRERRLSPVELTMDCLRQIERLEPLVKAWVTVDAEGALLAAKESERKQMRGELLGPLHGIPFGVKDIICTAGIRTSGGSKVNGDYIPDYDAAVVERLKRSGAILLGKTTTTEYAYQGGEPPTRNPWLLTHSPGGSSSGSAAAVAAGMALFTLGTQTFGSLLRPAAYNGLTCMKPTFGRISRFGVFTASWTLDHIGAFTRSAEDTAMVLEALVGEDARDPWTLPGESPRFTGAMRREIKDMVVGLPDHQGFFRPEELSIGQAAEVAADTLRGLGIRFKQIKMPECMDEAVAAHKMTMRAEGAAYHMDAYRETPELYGPSMREQLELGLELSAVDYLRAQRVRTVFRNEMMKLFGEVDVLLTPSTPTLPLAGYKTGNPMFNGPFTNTGLPSMTIPAGADEETGLPIGVQLAGPMMGEEKLLAIGHHYQEATRWHERIAPLVQPMPNKED
ncbi:amidase [Paenibacillus sp. strain BS8-2]